MGTRGSQEDRTRHSPVWAPVGFMISMAIPAAIAIIGIAVLGWAEISWLGAIVWGVILWALALLMMSTMGAVHPAIRRDEQEDPGPAATNFGAMTPVGSLMGHLVYGLVLGLAYQTWPLG